MRTKWFFLGCLTSVILVLGIITFSFLGFMKLSKKIAGEQVAVIKPGTVLHLKISGTVMEYNEFYDDYFTDTGTGAHSFIKKIFAAAYDENVKAILLEPAWMSCGYAVLNELKEALTAFKQQGKPVYAYLERAGNKDYLLAAEADEIFLNPSASGGILLTGVGSSMMFYKDLFDKIGIEVTVIHAGEYKGFGESYSRKKLSLPVRQNLEQLLENIYGSVLKGLVNDRMLSYEEAEYIFEERSELFISSYKAIEYDLVDELLFFEDAVMQVCGNENKLVNIKKYNPGMGFDLNSDKLAIVYLQGQILEENLSYGAHYINFNKVDKILDKLENDASIKGIVLRINSPGGSALESEIIFDRIEKFKQFKPVVISMSNVAASGGYYISAPGNYIFADPFTITGSIGVAAIIPNFNKLADKIGITTDSIKKGKYVDVFNPFTDTDPASINALKSSSNQIYLEFLDRVSASRGIPVKELRQVAGGRVWSSEDALQFKLIDAVGTLDDAVAKAAELAGMEKYGKSYYPAKKSIFEEFIERRFNLQFASYYLDNDLNSELGLKELQNRYLALKQDPLQSILPFQMK